MIIEISKQVRCDWWDM